MPFKFVPAYVENMATAALEYLPGCTLVNVVALGSYSAYEYTFAKEGYEPVSKRFGYDFGLPLPEDQRGRALAQQFEGLFVDTAKVEALEHLVETAQQAANEFNAMSLSDVFGKANQSAESVIEPETKRTRRNKGNK